MVTEYTQLLYILFILLFCSCSVLCIEACCFYSMIILMISYSNIDAHIFVFKYVENCPHDVSTLNLSLCSLFENG